MASPSYFLFVISLHVSVTLLYPICCYGQPFIIFGDSPYDPGNMQYLLPDDYIAPNHLPYGMIFFNHSTGRLSDGRLAPDFIAMKLNLPFMPPVLDPEADFTNGVNCAIGGAGILNTHTNTMNLNVQVQKLKGVVQNWTKEHGTNEAKNKVMNGVYLFSMGGDDYFGFATSNRNATESELQTQVNLVITNFTILLKEIYDLGARKFVFQNVAPMGCLPLMKQGFGLSGDACEEKSLFLAILHNIALSKLSKELESELPGFKYTIFDYYTAILNRVQDPTNYGFRVGDVACCGAGSYRSGSCGSTTETYELCGRPADYVYFDGAHTTEHTNAQLADMMFNGGPEVIAPYNMKQLFELDSTIKISSKESGGVTE